MQEAWQQLMVPAVLGELVVLRVKIRQGHKHAPHRQPLHAAVLRLSGQRSHVQAAPPPSMVPALPGELAVLHVELVHKHAQLQQPHNAEVHLLLDQHRDVPALQDMMLAVFVGAA